jgi:hypothetical protein
MGSVELPHADSENVTAYCCTEQHNALLCWPAAAVLAGCSSWMGCLSGSVTTCSRCRPLPCCTACAHSCLGCRLLLSQNTGPEIGLRPAMCRGSCTSSHS